MNQGFRGCLAAAGVGLVMALVGPAFAQKPGGILQMPGFTSPASMSIHEESTIAAGIPLMGVFNNLVLFDQHVPRNSLASIVPDLASDWSWDETGAALTFRLRQGVKWHDGKPFTARDVKCTWDALAGKGDEKFRVNPRKSWYRALDEITTNGDYEVTFHLRQGVKWHDGKPFTAADVKCTWDMLLGKSQDKLRLNPRKACTATSKTSRRKAIAQ